MSNCLIGIDIGTTLTKGVLINDEGGILAEAHEPCCLYSEHPAWSEEDPNEWWTNTTLVINQLLNRSKTEAEKIVAIGVSGMVPALVLIDPKGRPLRRSIQQNDARTETEIRELKDEIDETIFFQSTGGSINQQIMAPKLRWLRRHEPEILSQTHRIVGAYDFINYRLTDVYSLDHNWALESGLYDLGSGKWGSDLVALAGIDESILPPINRSDKVIGTVTRSAAEETGLKEGTLVIAGAADHVASAFAAGVWSDGDVLVKFGGAGDILYSTNNLVTDRRLFIDYHLVPGKYLLNGCMATSGSLVRWFVRNFCSDDLAEAKEANASVFEFLDSRIRDLPAGSDGLVLLPYFLGEKTPLHDPAARGTIFGLDLHHDRYHLFKAVLESVVYGFRHHFEVLSERNLPVRRVFASDGGAQSNTWLQIAADILQHPICRVLKHPGSSLGAAFLAGKAAGVFSRWEAVERYVSFDRPVEPRPEAEPVYDRYYKIYRAVYESLKPLLSQLAEARNLALEH